MFSVKDKVILITGSARGLGLAAARHFIDEGAVVITTDIRSSKEVEALNCDYLPLDVSDEQAVASVLSEVAKRYRRIDVLINNAGYMRLSGILDSSTDDHKRSFEINVLGVYYGIRYAAPYIPAGGSIINLASLAAYEPMAGWASYNISKRSVVTMTQCAAIELGPKGIRVNCVSPGNTLTATNRNLEGIEETSKLTKLLTPLGRMGEESDVIGVLHFLASPASKYVSGQSILVDGGWSAGLNQAALDKLLA